jgi:O-antigen ligase
MLFRPPDLQLYHLDRIAVLVLVIVVLLRTLLLRQTIWAAGPVTWPMLGLLLLALSGLLSQPYDPRHWAVFAAKWAVPFALFHLAQFAFADSRSLRQFESFCLWVLGYLCLTAVLFLFGSQWVFPPFILDESLGIHADRARGPFLQAVANGVSLNLLGLLALNAYRRGRLRGTLAWLFLAGLPLAMLATNTRAVWLSFAGSALILLFFSADSQIKRACRSLVIAGALGVAAVLCFSPAGSAASVRADDRSPVEFRLALYRAGWDMFLERPLLGWGASPVQLELTRRVSEFHPPEFIFHNSYLEIAVEHGLIGLTLYLWMLLDLFRIGRRSNPTQHDFLDAGFRRLWPVMVLVYVFNASFVVMSYQFVNGLLFTIAGMLAAQNRREVNVDR